MRPQHNTNTEHKQLHTIVQYKLSNYNMEIERKFYINLQV